MDDILSHLNQMSDVEEAWEERHFLIYRKGRALTVTVSDQGPSAGPHRFMAAVAGANAGDTTVSRGNPAPSIEDALSAVHWWEFD